MKSEPRFAQLGPVGPYYPEVAARRGVNGEAVIDCTLTAAGVLKGCKGVSEAPARMDFKAAALMMARRGWITAEQRHVDGAFVDEPHVQVHVPFVLGGGR